MRTQKSVSAATSKILQLKEEGSKKKGEVVKDGLWGLGWGGWGATQGHSPLNHFSAWPYLFCISLPCMKVRMLMMMMTMVKIVMEMTKKEICYRR